MSFFSQFPKKDVEISFLKTDSQGTISLDLQDKTITDIFRHVDVTTLNSENYTAYTYYNVQDGERPDIISQKLYNTPDYYWTFFIVNDFLQAGFNAFPKSSIDLDRGIQQEYGQYGALMFIPEYKQTLIPPEITGESAANAKKMFNQPGGLQLDKSFVRLVNKANSSTAKVYSWTPERLLLTTFGESNVNFYNEDTNIVIEDKYITATGTRLRKPQVYTIDISAGTVTEKADWLTHFNKQVQLFIDPDALGTNERVYTEANLSLYELTAFNIYKDLENAPYTFERVSTVDGEGEIGENIAAFDAIIKGGGFITNFTSWREYEQANNEARSQIVIVKPEFIERFAEEYRDLITS